MIDGTEENLLQTRLMKLRQQHRDLDAAISSLEASGTELTFARVELGRER